jgi:hypothetical protein
MGTVTHASMGPGATVTVNLSTLQVVCYWIFDQDGEPLMVTEAECMEWSILNGPACRTIARTTLSPQVEVSTVLLQSSTGNFPFETMVFGGQLDGDRLLSRSRADAEYEHDRMVALIQKTALW